MVVAKCVDRVVGGVVGAPRTAGRPPGRVDLHQIDSCRNHFYLDRVGS